MSVPAERFARAARAFLAAPGEGADAQQRAFAPLRALLRAVDAAALPEVAAPPQGWRAEALIARPEVNLSVFALRAGQAIPLHDHPGLHGALRVLRGRIRLETWDWDPPRQAPPAPGEAAVARASGVHALGPGDEALTLPARGALHRIEALEDAALLDLFAPYYDDAAGRRCSYYRAEPLPGDDGRWRLVR